MSRAAYWPTGADPAGVDGAAQSPTAAPTPPHGAPGAMLPVRSALDAQVKLARLATLLGEAAGILHELSEVQLAVHAERALMCDVEKPVTPARLLSVRDVAERLNLSEKTVRRLRRRGVLPAGIEIAGVLRWRPDEIDAWIGGQR